MIMARKTAATQRIESAPLLIRRIDAIPVSIPLVHLGYTVPNLDWGINITNHYLATDLVKQPLRQKDGSVECPTGPGLGVEVDEGALRRFRVKKR